MDSSKFIIGVVSVTIMVLLVGAMFLPVVASSTTRTIATTESNVDTDWLRFDYATTEDYSFEISVGADSLTVGTQTGELLDIMVYSCSDFALVVVDGKINIVIGGEQHDLGTSVSVVKDASGLTISGETLSAPDWAYYPEKNGQFAHFSHGDLLTDGTSPLATWGYFAGVLTFNESAPYGLELQAVLEDNVIDSASWVIPEPEEELQILPFNPDDVIFNPIDLDPLDPGIIDPDLDPGANVIMSADPQNGTRVGDLYYTFSGTNATVIGYASTIDWSTFTTIPDTVESGGVTYTVTSIGQDAFYNCTSLALTSLPSGITSIGKSAFSYCTNLALTSLPSGITSIGQDTFRNCTNLALTSLPSGLTSIGSSAFQNCTNLALTSLPSGLTSISNYAFQNCTNLALTSLPSGITSIGQNAFFNCTNLALTSLPSGLTSIGSSAFAGCSHLAITSIPGNPTIGQNAFKNSLFYIDQLIIEGNPTIGTLAFDLTGFKNLVLLGTPTYSDGTALHSNEIAEVLNLGSSNPRSGGVDSSAVIQDHIDADGYIAPLSITTYETVVIDSPTSTLIMILPLIAGVGVLMATVGMMIYSRF